MENVTELIRALVRPTVTLAFVAVMCVLALQARPIQPEFLGMGTMIVAWWFSDRSSDKALKKANDREQLLQQSLRQPPPTE